MSATQDRRWEVNLQVDEYGTPLHELFAQEVQQVKADEAAILLRLGGAIQSYVIRQQDPETGLWFPVKAVFKWQSFVPGIRANRAPARTANPLCEVCGQQRGAHAADCPAGPAPEPAVALEPEPGAVYTEEELRQFDEAVEPVDLGDDLADLNAAAVEAEAARGADDGEGQVFKKGAQRAVATSAAEQQELLRKGWKPVPQE